MKRMLDMFHDEEDIDFDDLDAHIMRDELGMSELDV